MLKSSSYAKILGAKLFRTWEIPRSGSKAKDGEKRKKEREREQKLVITMAKLRMAHAWRTHDARMAHASRLGQSNDPKFPVVASQMMQKKYNVFQVHLKYIKKFNLNY